MKNTSKHLILFLAILMFGCKRNDVIGDNDFNDLTGLQINLEWSLVNNTSDPTDAANLDLELTYNNSIVQESSSNFGFESVELRDFNPNGNYDLNIYYYEGDEPIDYTITVTGLSSFKTRQYKGRFTPNDKGVTYTIFEINKDGTDYSLF